ncbi:MAG: nitrous oxide-stimulated promoter family protein, partial [Candidatus Sericytochromatia bacterium]|nr:nitrous oxide-stimulated promoter family protein [Candidatus Tanganyikabacteria bacterium]
WEARTVRVMIGIHCRDLHGSRGGLCADCEGLWQYCQARVDRCPFYPDKPTCKNCRVHCYSPERRERIKEVMRYAGPRMMWQAPVLALLHMLDGRRSAPEKAPRARKQP